MIWCWMPVSARIALHRWMLASTMWRLHSGREGHAAAEPLLLAELENLVEGVLADVVAVGEVQLRRGDVARVDLLDEAVHHRSGERVPVDDLALRAAAGRRGTASPSG